MKPCPQDTAASRSRPILLAAVAVAGLLVCNTVLADAIRFLPLNKELADRKIGLQAGKSTTTLEDLNVSKRSKAYTAKFGKDPVSLVALDRERPNGKPVGVEIILPEDVKSPLVLILANADEPSGLRALVVEDDSSAFAWGSLRFINTTEKPYMVRCEKETQAIPEGLKPFDVVLGGEARNIGIQLFSEDQPETILYSAVWEHDPNIRKLVFIMPAASPDQQELKVAIIPQDQRAKNR